MHFEAEFLKKKFGINVVEQEDMWEVTLTPAGQESQTHCIAKADFQNIDDAISLLFENQSYILNVVGEGVNWSVYTRGSYRDIRLYNEEMLFTEILKGNSLGEEANELVAGMPGKIVEIFVKAGDVIKTGEALLIMEAMKMENEMRAQKTQE